MHALSQISLFHTAPRFGELLERLAPRQIFRRMPSSMHNAFLYLMTSNLTGKLHLYRGYIPAFPDAFTDDPGATTVTTQIRPSPILKAVRERDALCAPGFHVWTDILGLCGSKNKRGSFSAKGESRWPFIEITFVSPSRLIPRMCRIQKWYGGHQRESKAGRRILHSPRIVLVHQQRNQQAAVRAQQWTDEIKKGVYKFPETFKGQPLVSRARAWHRRVASQAKGRRLFEAEASVSGAWRHTHTHTHTHTPFAWSRATGQGTHVLGDEMPWQVERGRPNLHSNTLRFHQERGGSRGAGYCIETHPLCVYLEP